jgi:Zn-dependent peptidase ImmA (M78 family)
MPESKEKAVNPGRHEHRCTICAHAQREEIEREFVIWTSTATIAKQYEISRDSIYRHAHAVGLFQKRQRNIRAALEKIIERAGDVEVNASAVVSAVAAYSRINSSGQWVERSERLDLNQLFERMTRDELETYAKNGQLPAWFSSVVGATAAESQEATS